MCLNRPEFPRPTHHSNRQYSAAKCHGRLGLEQDRYHKHRCTQPHSHTHINTNSTGYSSNTSTSLILLVVYPKLVVLNVETDRTVLSKAQSNNRAQKYMNISILSLLVTSSRRRLWYRQSISHYQPHRLGPQHPHPSNQAKHPGPIC